MKKPNRYTADGYLKAVVGPFCQDCGESDVSVAGYLYWNEYEQEWQMDEIDYDRIWCNNCDCECDFEFKPMPREQKIKLSVRRRQEENNDT